MARNPNILGNTTIRTGPVRPEEYFSNANKIPSPCRSILNANVDARLFEREQRHAMQHGKPFVFDPKVHEIRNRYNKEFCLPGRANREKCCDDIC